MQVLVEPTEKGYRLSTGKPLDIVVEAETEEEALVRLKNSVARRLENARFVDVPLPTEPSAGNGVAVKEPVLHSNGTLHPLAEFAGDLKDDVLLPQLKQAMEEYRKEREQELMSE